MKPNLEKKLNWLILWKFLTMITKTSWKRMPTSNKMKIIPRILMKINDKSCWPKLPK